MGGGLSQTKKGHPVVHHFNARRRYLVRLVPHPDIATAGNFLHELPPWTQMWGFTVRCKAPQMLRAFPIAEQDGGAPEPLLTPEQPGLGIGGKMPHHRGHGRGYLRHLAPLPPSVGPHPDEEDGHCVAPDVRRKTSGKDLLCHAAPLVWNREFWISGFHNVVMKQCYGTLGDMARPIVHDQLVQKRILEVTAELVDREGPRAGTSPRCCRSRRHLHLGDLLALRRESATLDGRRRRRLSLLWGVSAERGQKRTPG